MSAPNGRTAWWLRVSYALRLYDIASADALIFGALGNLFDGTRDSSIGHGQRDLKFPFHYRGAAEAAERRLLAAGIPVTLETEVYGGVR